VAPVAVGTTEHNEAQQIPQKSRNLMVILCRSNLASKTRRSGLSGQSAGYQTYLGLGHKSLAYFQAGRYEQALQAVEQSLLLFPQVFLLKDKAVCCEKLGRHEDARDAVRRLREAEPSMTLENIERANALVFAAVTAADMNAAFRKVWLEAPLAPPVT
jgi:tetratricopeptide (TPR) repeat protein